MKQTINRIFAGTIFICVLFGMAFVLPVSAGGAPVVTASSVMAEAGSTVDVILSLENNPGLWSIGLKVGYDSSSLTLKSYRAGGIFVSDEITPPQSLSKQPFILSASKAALSNTTSTGDLVTLTFTVASTAIYKEYPITLEVESGNTINLDSQTVDIGTVNGKITVVECLHANTVWNTVTAATCEERGREELVCVKCNEVLDTRIIAALGHNYVKKVVSDSTKRSNATTTSKATYFYTCERCGEISNDRYFTAGDVVIYKLIAGANSTWQTDGTTDLTFTADGNFEKFTGVKVNGVLVDKKNYSAKSGSTVVTLKADYLRTLKTGKHTFTFVYSDGEISSDFTIAYAPAVSSESDTSDSEESIQASSNNVSSNEVSESDALSEPLPENNGGYLIYILISVLLIVCIGATFVYLKKVRRL